MRKIILLIIVLLALVSTAMLTGLEQTVYNLKPISLISTAKKKTNSSKT